MLAAWAIPEPILAAAPADPFEFPADLFAPPLQACSSTALEVAADALSPRGSVLDVGCASGAASLALGPAAELVTGVDSDPHMVAQFEAVPSDHSALRRAVLGRWPDVASEVDVHDVAVSHHVLYNVAPIESFLATLTTHARRRVVLEVTRQHPQADLNALWRRFHGIERPEGPVVDDIVAVLLDLGIVPTVTDVERPTPPEPQPRESLVAFARRRLCLDESYDAAIDELLPAAHSVPPRAAACIWWDTADVS